MIKNYWVIAWRLLLKNKLYSAINIIGLAAGMAVALLIGLWVRDELTFNHYHRNHARLACILSIYSTNGEITVGPNAAVPLAAALRSRFPGDFKDMALVAEGGHILTIGDKKIEQWGMYAQSAFPIIFSLQLLKGSPIALKDPSSLLLAESLARSLFGEADPINKKVLVDGQTEMKVGGIYKDLPENSRFYGASFLLAWDNISNRGTTLDADWYDHHFELYVQLNNHADFDQVAGKIKDLTKPHIRGGIEETGLYPMDQWHLYDEFRNGKVVAGQIRLVRLFALIGCLVLLLACINFMNLSTARSGSRAKEVGLRKAVGSRRSQLVGQFLSESLLMTGLALVIALIGMVLFLPLFNTLAGKQLLIPWAAPWFLGGIGCFTLVTGFIAGSYPAFYLSGFRPVKALSGAFRAGPRASVARKLLVVLQFTVSIALVIGILVIFRQISYARNRPVGYTREGLITLNMNTAELQGHYDALREELIASGAVDNMAESSSVSTDVENSMLGYDWKGKDPNSVPIIGTLFVTYDFGATLGWKIKEGRDFSREFPTDSGDSALGGSLIINEAAVAFTRLRHPVGEVIRRHGQDHPIVGVVKDLVMESPYRPVQPTFFMLQADRRIHVITIRIKPALPVRQALTIIGGIFRKYAPGSPFGYAFTDDVYAAKFRAEEHVGNLAGFFAGLAVGISCLGLFGLAAFMAEQRTKEIGIRKVLGASVLHLWGLLSKEFAVLVLLSFGIAAPIAWYYGNKWLQAYEYRTTVPWWIFALTGSCAQVIALLVVSVQSVKAALMNPVRSLKAE